MPSSLLFVLRYSLVLVTLFASALVNAQTPTTSAQLPAPATTQLRVIDSVEYLLDDSTTPPDSRASWQSLTLPLGSRIGNANMSNRVLWLRFQLQQPATDQLHSLYFYRRNLSLDVFFNDIGIGGDNYRAGRQTVGWNRPLLVDIQQANWRAENNVVHIRFLTSYYGGTFAPIIFGEKQQLLPLYEQRIFRQITVNEWLQALGVITAILAFILWSVRRRDSAFLYFSAMTMCWVVLTTHMVVYYNILDYQYWLRLVHITIDLFALFMYGFLVRHVSIPSPKGERAIRIWVLLAIGWHLLAPLNWWWLVAYGIHFVGNGFTVYLLARIVRKALREKDAFAIAISLTLVVQMGLFSHDLLMVLFAGDEDWESAMYYSLFAFPLLLAVFAATLLHRFVSALNLSESLNRNLEAKVEASRRVIEQSYAARRQLELEQATEQERLSIYRDLHDDVGSKLLSIVHAGRGSRMGDLARTALESLRNAVSRANSPEQHIVDFMNDLREEAQLRLEGSGHAFVWKQSNSFPNLTLTSSQVFNLSQIVRELVSNIIRHANASTASIEIDVSNSNLLVRVTDNGIGLNTESINGNGQLHIQQRLDELTGTLQMTSGAPTGLVVLLEIPIITSN